MSGALKLDAAPVTDGDKLGLQASATLDVDVTADGAQGHRLRRAGDAGASAKAKVEVSFNDVPAPCPTAAGKVAGKLAGKVKVTLTTPAPAARPRPSSPPPSCTVDYAADGRRERALADDRQRRCRSRRSPTAARGKGTETWRGRRARRRLRRSRASSAADFSAAIAERLHALRPDQGRHLRPPHVDQALDTGPTAWDIQSISNLKGLIVTPVATDYLTLAALEYIRERRRAAAAEALVRRRGLPEARGQPGRGQAEGGPDDEGHDEEREGRRRRRR